MTGVCHAEGGFKALRINSRSVLFKMRPDPAHPDKTKDVILSPSMCRQITAVLQAPDTRKVRSSDHQHDSQHMHAM